MAYCNFEARKKVQFLKCRHIRDKCPLEPRQARLCVGLILTSLTEEETETPSSLHDVKRDRVSKIGRNVRPCFFGCRSQSLVEHHGGPHTLHPVAFRPHSAASTRRKEIQYTPRKTCRFCSCEGIPPSLSLSLFHPSLSPSPSLSLFCICCCAATRSSLSVCTALLM